MDDVVNADKVSVVRPIDLPSGTYSPDAVVTIDSGNRNEPLKKLPLGELMPNTDNASVFAVEGTTLSEDGEFSVAGVLLTTGDGIRSENGKVYLDAGNYHLSATFIVWSGSDVADRVIDTVMEASLGSTHALVTEVGTAYDMSLPDNYTTVTMACDLAVNGSGTELHLSVEGLPDDSEDEYGFVNVTVERLSVHRITSVATAGGGDTPSGDCNVHVIDLQFLTEQEAANIWQECVEALLDGKLLAVRVSQSTDGVNSGFTTFCEQTMSVPDGYTKESYIEYLRSIPWGAMLSFYVQIEISGGLLREYVKFTITPIEGLRWKWFGATIGGLGITLTDYDDGKYGSDDLFTIDYTDPDNFRTSSEFLPDAMIDIHSRGVPLRLSCWNSTRQFNIVGPLYLLGDGYFTISSYSIAAYYEDPADELKSGDIPVQYKARLSWVSDPSFDDQFLGYYRIVSDAVYPLALDTNFNGPITGGTP